MSSVAEDHFEFRLGPRIVCQPGLAAQVGLEAARYGTRVLLVTDAGVRRAGLLEPIISSITAHLALVGVFDAAQTTATPATIATGAAMARDHGADLLVAVGGGSVIDVAKCIAIQAASSTPLPEALAEQGLRPLPLIAIPTTAGTGSEVNSEAGIYGTDGRRLRLRNPALAPVLTLLDAELTRSLPPSLTAATGMHALSNAVEAFVSTSSSLPVESLALYAIDIIANYLRDATHDGNDLGARSKLLVAASMAGMALSNASAGIVGAMAEAVAAPYSIHLGVVHSLLLPYGMQFNYSAVPNRYQRVARALGIQAGGRAEVDVIGDSITETRSLAADCNLPLRLRDLGVAHEHLPDLAAAAAADEVLGYNPRPATAADILAILDEAW